MSFNIFFKLLGKMVLMVLKKKKNKEKKGFGSRTIARTFGDHWGFSRSMVLENCVCYFFRPNMLGVVL